MRVVLAVVAVLAVAVGLACALVPSTAASVGGVAISRTALYRDLDAIAGSPVYSCALTGSVTGTSGAGVAGTTSDDEAIFSASFAGHWLDQLVGEQLRADLVRREQLAVTPTAVRWARAELVRQVTELLRSLPTCHGGTGSSVVASLPGSFVDRLVVALADTVALDFRAVGVTATTMGLAGYYAGHAVDFDRECLTYVAYRTAQAATVASATAAQIRAGTLTIEAAAAAAQTTDSTAIAPVAYSSCGDRLGTAKTPIVNGPVDAVVGPLRGTGSYLVSEVTASRARSFPAARTDVVAAVVGLGGATVARAVARLAKQTVISIDPRYGIYRGGGVASLAGPPPGAALTPGADTPQ